MSDVTASALGELGQISHVVSDLDRAVEFLRDQVGLRLLFQFPPGLAFFALGRVRLMVTKPEGGIRAGANSTLYFKVKDIVAVRSAMQERGVVFEDEPHLIAKMPDHELWMTFFRDPDGSLLGLMEEKR
ncbi:MAG: VOC family protein [Cephaloticoccus sp.]|nr:VOC family protein [Cephaloticoccus sp.]MCF7761340.1 VOC family protein [Cephaloticoccus sp.]